MRKAKRERLCMKDRCVAEREASAAEIRRLQAIMSGQQDNLRKLSQQRSRLIVANEATLAKLLDAREALVCARLEADV